MSSFNLIHVQYDSNLFRTFRKKILNNQVVYFYLPDDRTNLRITLHNRIICILDETYVHFLLSYDFMLYKNEVTLTLDIFFSKS